jgi:hypothetical protein
MAKQNKPIYYDLNLLIKIDAETRERVQAMAEARKTTMSEFVRRCINERYEAEIHA